MSIIEEIATERRRQIEAEGWTPEHDDEHANGEMARAAACYATGRQIIEGGPTHFDNIAHLWPWSDQWWKPSADPRRNYIKAAALLVAEIERHDRLNTPASALKVEPA
jgi:hypothetical protein